MARAATRNIKARICKESTTQQNNNKYVNESKEVVFVVSAESIAHVLELGSTAAETHNLDRDKSSSSRTS